jgi:phosphoserine aminotransferase
MGKILSFLAFQVKTIKNLKLLKRIYVCGLVFEWLKKQGGIESIDNVNKLKSSLLYEIIDASNGFYK